MSSILFFFFNDTATTEIYTLSLHDALPIYTTSPCRKIQLMPRLAVLCSTNWVLFPKEAKALRDRKSTRLNSSHLVISYAVFCLKKKKPVASQKRLARGHLWHQRGWCDLHRL